MSSSTDETANGKDRRQDLLDLLEKLKVPFKDLSLLDQALSHASYANEVGEQSDSNNVLEFLGDSVLNLVISLFLYKRFPSYTEGELSKLRSVIVSQPILADRAKQIELGKYLLLGKGEETAGGRERDSILSDSFEAVVAAIYLDCGLETAERCILELFEDEIVRLDTDQHKLDYKSLVQEHAQSRFHVIPKYSVVKESGPDHDKSYEVVLTIDDLVYGRGTGKTKKEAEQRAAEEALKKLDK